eukprot:CAMPEP_0178392398 /NCGR_PEP_ID=MMETSP0689_2-20121128/11659_1 /TAXON_ID=160604 /ORGANISM="Amphidinium massartii, Strain CS-259" /LENGTH=303 /DNA_ID=CAMNT_0020012973 /DNA_START=124 /DNA_END=1032 /DNA_ORIENTATION=+
MSPWVVNLFEAASNVVVGAIGLACWQSFLPGLRQRDLAVTGFLQLLSKFCASRSRVMGLPGPVLTLAKSARPLPVMVGQRVIAGTRYTPREYVQYTLLVAAGILVSSAKSPLASDGVRLPGVLLLILSMFCDGYAGGVQKGMKARVRTSRKALGVEPEELQMFEMQFFTNLYMSVAAGMLALVTGDLWSSLKFMREMPDVVPKVAQYAACSAIGQIFIFACMTHFDPLILSVVTTSRKITSVCVTLLVFGYELDGISIFGLVLAAIGTGLLLHGEAKQNSKTAVQRPDPRVISAAVGGPTSPT